MKTTLLLGFLLCAGYAQAQTQTYPQALKIWEFLKESCDNSYTYTLEDMSIWHQPRENIEGIFLDVTVKNGKVVHTRHRLKYWLRTNPDNLGCSIVMVEKERAVDSTVSEFAGQKVGTMDDMLAYYGGLQKKKLKTDERLSEEYNAFGLPTALGYITGVSEMDFTGFVGYQLRELDIAELNRFEGTWEIMAVTDLKKNQVFYLKKKEALPTLYFTTDHAEFKRAATATYCYDYYQVDLSEKTIRFRAYDTDFVHYECDNNQDDEIEKAYLEATGFRWLPNGNLELLGKKYRMELQPAK